MLADELLNFKSNGPFRVLQQLKKLNYFLDNSYIFLNASKTHYEIVEKWEKGINNFMVETVDKLKLNKKQIFQLFHNLIIKSNQLFKT